MKKVFVTAIGGDIGYGIIKALRNSHHDTYIIGCDTQRYNYGCDLVDKFFVAPSFSDEEKWLEYIKNMIEEYHVDFFWPVTENEIQIVDRNRNEFKSINTVINDKHILDVAFDKGYTAEFLDKIGICTPKTWCDIETVDKEFPLIVKEKCSCGSHGVKVVHDGKELVSTFKKMKNPVIQELVGNKDEEYTMTVFSDGKIINSIVFRRELGLGSMSRFVELVHNNQCTEIAERIVKETRLKGSINVQMRKKLGKYCVFEINPRISSTIGFRQKLGFNDVEWWLDMIEKKEVSSFICKAEKAVGIRGVEEKVFWGLDKMYSSVYELVPL